MDSEKMKESVTENYFDFVLIGGGIVGLSTAMQLKKKLPEKRILVLEKENDVAFHQTGRNSGVIHAGVYYQPGSLKADFCKRGLEATIKFAQEQDLPYEQCGKLIVATTQEEIERMHALHKRCLENGLTVEVLDQELLKQKEPNIDGLGALFISVTGIIDYGKVCNAMSDIFQSEGGQLWLDSEMLALKETDDYISVKVKKYKSELTVKAGFLINCAGLMADRIARMLKIPVNFRIIPFRGEYYKLPEKNNGIVNHLIYPVPDPNLPFLGVHLTRKIDGSVIVGPNAVLGWKREGYGRINIRVADIIEMMGFSGFWKVMRKHLFTGIVELYNSLWKPGYLKQVRKYCPTIGIDDLEDYPAGIRAQAVLKDGTLVHDFLFVESSRSFHVCNAPSPAATSAIPIGEYLVQKIIAKANA